MYFLCFYLWLIAFWDKLPVSVYIVISSVCHLLISLPFAAVCDRCCNDTWRWYTGSWLQLYLAYRCHFWPKIHFCWVVIHQGSNNLIRFDSMPEMTWCNSIRCSQVVEQCAHIHFKCEAVVWQNSYKYFVDLIFFVCNMFERNWKSADKAEKPWKWKRNKKPVRDGMQTHFGINICRCSWTVPNQKL